MAFPLVLLLVLLALAAALLGLWQYRTRLKPKRDPVSEVTYTCNLCGERDCQCAAHKGDSPHE